ncbi:Ig-like domain-containing protein [Aeromonas veronii]|uniref:Ig-like domain-containing protein n=1 Tax=Aeromonas veronii TaxID=654 RepID=UPI003F79099D
MITNAVTLEQGVTVTQLKGQIYLVAADGSRKLLAEGDVLPKGAVIMSPDGASFMGGGQSFTVQPASEQSEPAEEGDVPQLAQNGAAGTPDDINALQQAILGGADPTQAFEASAAGGAPAAGGGGIGGVAGASGNGGFVTIDRTGSETIAEATFDTTYNNGEPPLGAAGEDEVFDLTPPTISVVAPDNTNDTTPTLTGTTDAPVGSIVTLLVTDANGNQQTLTAIVTPGGTFTVDVVTPLAEGSYTVTATVTDPAGNSGSATDGGSVDATAPAVSLTITDDTNDDGLLSSAELSGQVNYLVALGAGTALGDTLVIVDQDGNELFNGAVTQAMLDNGLSLAVDAPADGQTLTLTATVIDPAGNSDSASDSVTLDATAPAVSLTITDDTNDDGLLSSAELSGQVNYQVALGAGTALGDTLVIVDQDGNELFNGAVTQAMLDNGLSLAVDAPADGQTLTLTATVTDPAGNSDSASDSVTLDATAPAVSLTITDDINDDGLLSSAELSGQVNYLVALGAGTALGDTLVIVDQDGNELFNGAVTQAMLDNGLSLAVDAPADGQTLTLTATATDPAGNSDSASDSVTLDATAPAVSLTITDDINDDGLLSSAELSGQVNYQVALGAGTALGDTLVIVDQDGNELFNGAVTQAMLDNGLSLAVDAPADGQTLTLTATVTDPAGNSDSASDSVTLDATAPAVSLTITDDTNDDGLLSSAELSGQVNYQVALGAGTALGDTLVIVDQDGNELFNGAVTQAMLDNGLSLAVDAPADGQTLTLTATATDPAGNSDSASDSVTLDATAPAVSLTITDDINDDGLLSSAELSGQVNYQVALGAGTALGDTLVIVDQDGNELFNGAVTQAMLDNGLSLAVDAPADGQTLTLTATVTDPAGNSDSASDSVTVDSHTPNAPTVLIVDDGTPGDGLLTQGEIDGNGAGVQLTVSIDAADFSAGGHVNLTIVNGTATSNVELKLVNDELQFANGTPATGYSYNATTGVISWTETAPGEGKSITVTATQTDKAGNTSAEGTDTALVDTAAPNAPTVLIVDDGTPGDGLLTQGEIDGNGAGVQLTVSIDAADFSAGGHVNLTIVNGTATSNVELKLVNDELQFANGTPATGYSYNATTGVISWTETAPGEGKSITVTATQTDKAGNTSAEGTDTALVDTAAPNAPTVLIVDDGTPGDGLLTQGEIDGNGAGVQLTVSIDAADFSAGGHVNLTIVNGTATSNVELKLVNGELQLANGQPATGFTYNNGTISWTETAPANGQGITVTATQTDKAGNTSAEGTDTALVDTAAPNAPTVLIVDDGTPGDGLLTQGEIDGNGAGVQLTVSIDAADFSAGGHVNLTIVNGTATSNVALKLVNGELQLANGQPATGFTYNNGTISWTETAPANGQGITVTATQTDKAGNTSAEGTDTALVDTAAPNAPTVLIVDDGTPGDGLLTQGEIDGNGAGVQLTVSIDAADFSAGGHVNLTIVNGTATSNVELKLVNDELQFANGTPATGYSYNATTGVISWTETAPGEGKSITVTATQTDKAGNTSAEGTDTALVDTAAPNAPTVLIVDDGTPGDGLLTQGEIDGNGAGVQLTVSIDAADFSAGGHVNLTIVNGTATSNVALKLVNGELQLANGQPATGFTYNNGTISWTETAPANGQGITVTATQTDKAGNTSAEGTDTALVDTAAPNAPTVLIVDDGTPGDGLLTQGEIDGNGAGVQLTVSIDAADFSAGGHVNLTIVNGTATSNVALKLVNGELQLANGQPATGFTYNNGTISWTETAPANGQGITVTATQTDKAGNTSAEGTDTALVDTAAPNAPTVLIVDDGTPGDGLLTQGEIDGNGAGVQLTVSIDAADFSAGGHVNLTIVNGTATSNVELKLVNDELQFANGTPATGYSYNATTGVISWTETAPGEGKSITVTATQTDKAGNTSAEGTDTALVDTAAPNAPTVLIVDDGTPGDGLLTQGEIDGNGAGVQLTVSIDAADFSAGGHVNLTIVNGTATSNVELKLVNGELQLANGQPATGFTYNNGTISWTETAPANGQGITVTATQTDKAGNTSAEGTDTALVDTAAPNAPTVLIVDDGTPGDGLLTQGEIDGNGAGVQLTVSIDAADFSAGGHVNLTIVNGTATSNVELKLVNDELQFANGTPATGYSYNATTGVISWTETAPGEGKSITVTATQTDKAGNTSAEGTDTALVDTAAPNAPTVLIVDDGTPGDGLLTQGEIDGNGAGVQLTVSIDAADFSAGGHVNLTIVNGTATSNVELKLVNGELQLANGQPATGFTYNNGTISWTETAPANGQGITVTATQTDKAGNTSAEGTDTALVDTAAPNAPTVLIVDDGTPGDGLLTQGEIDGNGAGVQLTVSIDAADFSAGGHVNLTIVNGTATSNVELKLVNDELQFANGTPATGYSYNATTGVISWTETAPGEGKSITVTATQTDKAGNTSAEGTDTALVDTAAPNAPTVLIVDDGTPGDGLLTQGEIDGNGAGVQLTVSIDAADFSAGGHVNLTIVNGTATSNVELKLVNDELQFANGTPATGYSYNATTGVISWTETAPGEGKSITVTATQTDKAGNTSAEGTDTALVDTAAPNAPTVLIVDDGTPGDGLLTQGEIDGNGAGVQLTVSIDAADFSAGGHVNLTIVNGTATSNVALKLVNGELQLANGQPATGFTYNNGTISWTETAPANGQGITVTATQTDKAGNTSAEGTDTALVDTAAPNAPTVLIVDDGTPGDGLLTQGEIDGNGAGVQLTVSIDAADFSAGGHVNLTIVNGTATSNVALKLVNGELQLANGQPATGFTYNNGTISWTETAPANGQGITVTATQTDKAGNTSAEGTDTALVDTAAPNAPTVLIVDDGTPGDGLLTQGEIDGNGAGVQLTVSIDAADFSAGGHVNLTIVNGTATSNVALKLVNGELQLANGQPATGFTYNNGTISWTETAPANGQGITVTATQTDKAGNTSAEGTDTALVDTAAPNAPTVLIVDDGTPGDGLLTQGEIDGNGAGVQLTVSIDAADFSAGGHVNLTIVNGTATSNVALKLVNGELQLANGQPATGFTYNNGTISWTETAPANGQGITVTATQTDKAGNTSAEGTDTALVDTAAPNAPTVLIVDDGTPGDGLLTQGEIDGNGAGVQLTVSIDAADFSAGGHVNLTIVNGTATSNVELKLVNDELQFANGTPATGYSYNATTGVISWTETAPGEGKSITVTATQTDKAGNTSAEGTDTALVDTAAPNAPTVLIVDDGTPGDGLLTQGEIDGNGAGVQLTVSIDAADFSAGGHVNLTIVNGTATSNVELKLVNDELQLANGQPATGFTYNNGTISWTETAPANGQGITVTATQTDKAGNTSAEGTDTALVDTAAPNAPTVLIVDDGTPGDGLLTQGEIDGNGAGVQLTVSIDAADFSAGGHVNLTIVNGTATSNVALKLVNGELQLANGQPATGFTYNNGTISWTETAPANGQGITVTATQTDKAGNTSAEGTDTALVDTAAPNAPTVLIVDDGTPGDGLLTQGEIDGNGAGVQLTVSIDAADFSAGGHVNLTIVNGTATSNVALKLVNGELQLANGQPATGFTYNNGTISWTETAPANGQGITVTATQTDKAGNTSAEGTDTALVDTAAPNAPTVLIVDDGTPGDGLLTQGEIDGNGAGVQLTVSIDAADFSAGGHVNLTIVNGTATSNVALKLVNGELQLANGQPATGFTYNNGTISWTETAPANGQGITVTATQTDKAGNTSAEGTDTALVDTAAPNAPTVLIVDDGTPGDGLLTQGEIDGNGAGVQLTVSIDAADFSAGGHVNLTIVNGTATSNVELKLVNGELQLANGQPATGFTYNNGTISWTETAPANGQGITVTATQTDKAGNTSAEGTDTALVDTAAPNAPTVLIVDDGTPGDGLLTQGEIDGNGAGVQLTVSIDAADFSAGGHVNLTIVNGTATSNVELKLVNGELQLANGQPATGFTYNNGTISWTETAPANGQGITVTATQTDKAGNTSAEGTDTALVDTAAPNAPTVLIVDDGTPGDGLLTQGEIDGNGAGVQLTVSIDAADFSAGGHVNLTIVNGTATSNVALKLVNGELQLANGQPATGFTYNNGTISWTEAAPANGQGITVTATQTDKAGNTSAEGTDTALVDTAAPNAPTVLIVDDGTPGDGLLTQGEIDGNGAGVQLTVSIDAADFSAGGHVNLTIVNGTATSNVELKLVNGELQLANGQPATGFTYNNGTISWTETAPANGQGITVTATQTDKAGNTSAEGTDTALVDTAAPNAPTVLIVDDGTPGDGLLTQGEIDGNGAGVQLTVSIDAADFSAGGHVNLTIVNGTVTSNVELKLVNDELQFANGTPATGYSYNATTGVISWTETAPGEGKSITVTATQTDAANSTSGPGSDTAKVYTPGNCNIVVNESTLRDGGSNVASEKINFTAGTQALTAFNFNSSSINAATNLAGHNITWAIATNGALIGSINGQQAIILTLSDISTISPGTSGNVTVNVELLDNLLQNNGLGGENLSALINGIVIEGTTANGSLVTGNVSVEIIDDVPNANNDTGSVDVIVDSFIVSGVEANWTSWTNGTSVTTFDGNSNSNGGGTDNDDGLDQIRWGNPTNTYKSGYGFIDNDSALNGQFALNQEIILGTFTHYNFPISSGGAITKATMDVTFSVTDAYGVVTPVTLNVNFDHNETPNDNNDPEASKDIIKVGNTNVTFEHQGQVYTLQVIGFRVPGTNQVVTEIRTAENAASSYELVVRIVAGNGYELPSTEGNVLTNDVIGADSDLTVVGAATGDQTGSGTTGSVGVIINGIYGTLIIDANGSYTYKVTANASAIPAGATETFTYTMQDADGDQSSALLTINVNTVNVNALKAVQDQKSGPEDTAVIGNVLENDGNKNTSVTHFTVANDTNQYTAGSKIILTAGELTLNADGSYTFKPADDWNGQVPVVTYTTNTGATSTLTIVVTPVDDPTVTESDSNTVAEDAQAKGNVLENDTDADNTLSVTNFQVNNETYTAGSTWYQLPEGELQFNTNGEYSFVPKEYWSGSLPVITYTTNTGVTSTLNITVEAVANAPTLTVGNYTNVASINFEDAKFNVNNGWGGVIANQIDGLNTLGKWYTSNSGGRIEVGFEKTYQGGGSTNKVMEIEFNNGDDTLYTDMELYAGRFYELGFDIAARLGHESSSKLTIKLIPLDNIGQPIMSQAITLYDFNKNDSNWLRDQKVSLPVNASGNYRLLFEADSDADSVGAILDNLSFSAVDNLGYIGNFIKLGNINAQLVDDDNSESLSIKLQGLPEDAILKDGNNHQVTVDANGEVDITGWNLNNLQIKVANHGNFTITVVATATEASNQDSAQSTAYFQVTVLHKNNVVGGQSVDSFMMTDWSGDTAQFAVNLGGYGSVASSSKTQYIAKDTELLINAGDSNDYIDLGVSTANNIVNTGSSLPNVNHPVVTQDELLSSQFMTQDVITNTVGTLKEDARQPLQPKTDTVNLGSGDDIVNGGEGSQVAHGGSGNDQLIGGEGIDGLRGGLGDDILIGGLGNDVLRGDEGADIFVWNKGDTVSGSQTTDYIMDFNKGSGTNNLSEGDKLDLSDLLDSPNQNDLTSLLSVIQGDDGVHLFIREDSSSTSPTQEIVLMNHTFDSLTGGSDTTTTEVLEYMLNNILLIDKPHG